MDIGGASAPAVVNVSPRRRWLYWLIGAVAVVGNALLYLHLSAQTAAIQRALVDVKAQLRAATVVADSQAAPEVAQPPLALSDAQRAMRQRAMATANAASRVQTMKQRAVAAPGAVDAKLASAMTAEPSSPEVERKQYDWLREAMQAMPSDGPKITDARTTCQGRRCEVAGVFASDDEARAWARRYLLAGGGRLLQSSNVVVLPLAGGSGQVELHLYLH
ncbi:MAG: hypothetical protein JSS45_13980 [Proteobacteria bacterium]|nr:hypothetical protein [Pseudomonadota bacterium]